MNDAHPSPPYFTAAPWKLALMSFCTAGFYEFYWFHKNWKLYKARTDERIWPGWRAIFSPIWAYSLFRDIRSRGDSLALKTNFDPLRVAIAYVLLFLAQWLGQDYIALASIFTFVPIIIAGQLASSVNAATVAGWRENDRLSAGNWFVVIIGGFLNIGDKFFHPDKFTLDDLLNLNRHLMF